MTELVDRKGVAVTVEKDEAAGAFTISLAGHGVVGKSFFLDAEAPNSERFFYHTEVDGDFSGRGLAGLLVGETLSEARKNNLTVVPICPFYISHLKKKGDEYVEQGGKHRKPTPSEFSDIKKKLRGE